jgi:hypothetical protein
MRQRLSRLIRFSLAVALSAAALCLAVWAAGKPAADTTWRISGDLSEACSCSVPCSCNFGEGPSPKHFCWAVFSLDIQKGRYGTVNLDGLRLAAGCGARGMVFYIDDRATPAQAAALRAITTQMMARFHKVIAAMDPRALQDPTVKLLAFKTAHIEQEVGKTRNRLVIGSRGGFESDYVIGIDGKTPVVVENNWSWNIQHGIKGKTKRLRYKDEFGNEFEMTSTNANQGRFDWSDKTPVYFR